MRLVASIFNSPQINGQIDEVHDLISNQEVGIERDDLDLVDFLSDPNTSFRQVSKHRKIRDAMLSGKAREPQWAEFGFKAGPECTMLSKRFQFVCDLNDSEMAILTDSDAKPEDVQRLSLRCTTNGVALAFKYFWIVKGFTKPFRGMQATTRPVKDAINFFWGNIGGGDMLAMSDFQHRLSHELEMEPNRLNTALWILGKKLQQEAR